MPNLVKVTGDPLSDGNLKLVIKELDETAVAASVTGTSHRRMRELATLVEAIAGALVGQRPEVRKAAKKLLQLAQNARVSGVRNYQAPRAMRAMQIGVEEVAEMLERGTGRAPVSFSAGEFSVGNAWGYTEAEAWAALRALEKTSRALRDVGLGSAVTDIGLSDEPAAAKYDDDADMVVINPGKSVSADDVLRELGERIWAREFIESDYETWGGRDSERFTKAFSGAVLGRRLDADTAARLQMTVGRLAAKWPEVA